MSVSSNQQGQDFRAFYDIHSRLSRQETVILMLSHAYSLRQETNKPHNPLRRRRTLTAGLPQHIWGVIRRGRRSLRGRIKNHSGPGNGGRWSSCWESCGHLVICPTRFSEGEDIANFFSSMQAGSCRYKSTISPPPCLFIITSQYGQPLIYPSIIYSETLRHSSWPSMGVTLTVWGVTRNNPARAIHLWRVQPAHCGSSWMSWLERLSGWS